MKKFLIFILMLLPATLPEILYAKPIRLPVPELETLPNGLQIAWFLNDSLPVVDMVLLVKSGYRDDPAGKSGTSELVSASLDRGAGGLNAQQLAIAVEKLGASRYAASDEDTFSVGVHGLAPDAPALLDILAKLSLKPEFPEEEVKREQARLLSRWSHLGDSGDTLASLTFHRVLTAGTTYGRGSLLSANEFKKVGREDVLAFHKTHFTPKNSLLMIVGRVNRQEFRAKVEAAFGTWSGEAPTRKWVSFADSRLRVGKEPSKVSAKKPVVYLVERPDLTQAQVRIGFRAPGLKIPEHYALSVGNALLGEYFQSRLNAEIRDKLGITYAIGSSFSYSKDLAKFAVASATRNETVGQLITQSLSILGKMKKGPIAEDEVTTAKEYLSGGFPLSASTLNAVASRWASGYLFELGPEYLNEFVPKVTAVTREQVQSAVAKHFDLDHLVIVVAGNGAQIAPTLKGFEVKRVSVQDLM